MKAETMQFCRSLKNTKREEGTHKSTFFPKILLQLFFDNNDEYCFEYFSG